MASSNNPTIYFEEVTGCAAPKKGTIEEATTYAQISNLKKNEDEQSTLVRNVQGILLSIYKGGKNGLSTVG